MDKRVEIHGTSRADMNGKRGVATDFHPMGGPNDRTQDRYTVQLDSGEAFKLKPANVVRAEGPGGASSDGKAKGKGKKGKRNRDKRCERWRKRWGISTWKIWGWIFCKGA